MVKVNLQEKLALFSEHWRPRVVGDLNGQQVKLAKLKGEFDRHHHEHEDELFLVLKGTLLLRLRDREIILGEGEFFMVNTQEVKDGSPEDVDAIREDAASANEDDVALGSQNSTFSFFSKILRNF